MVSPRWRKVLRDLFSNKARTVLVALSIAMGVFAVGVVSGSYLLMLEDVPADYFSANPYDAIIFSDPFDDDLIEAAFRTEGVRHAEGITSVGGQVTIAGDRKVSINITGIYSLEEQQINKLRLEQGSKTIGDKEIYIERGSVAPINAKVGDTLKIELVGGKIRELRIAGIVHDVSAGSFTLNQRLSGYVDFETLVWLGGSTKYNQMVVTMEDEAQSQRAVQIIADRVADKIKRSGREVYVTIANDPNKHPAQFIIDAVLALMGGMGILALFLCTFLVINTISALMSQQVRQIGVMKAVGATAGQVLGMYMVLIMMFSLVALLLAIPLSAVAAYSLSQGIAMVLNVNLGPLRVPASVLIIQVAIGLFVPIAASLVPILNGARMTVREAMSSYGIQTGGVRSFFDRMLENIQGLPRPLLLSIRNTFRKKARLALTLFTLMLGGAIFIAVFNVQASLYEALDITFGYILSDVNVDFGRAYRMERIRDALSSVPGIEDIEGWGFSSAQVMKGDTDTGDEVMIFAPPSGSKFIRPVMSSGRWLVEGDENAIVVGNHLIRLRPEIKVGDMLNYRIEGKDYPFRVVGVYKMAGNVIPPIVYANFEYLARIRNEAGLVYSIRVKTTRSDQEFQSAMAKKIEAQLKGVGMSVGGVTTGGETVKQQRLVVDIMIYLLLVMAVLIAMVGGLGLMGTMSLNVLERTREIGVMRSIGAVDSAVMQLVLVEGMVIGLISWAMGALLSIPITHMLDNLIGVSIVTVPLDYVFSMKGMVLWVVIVIVLSSIASFIPARNAVRLTIRDVLAYE